MTGDTELDPIRLIDDRYAVDVSQRLPFAGGGLAAFAATDRRASQGPLMAVRVSRNAPPRPRALQALSSGIDGLAAPLAHGSGPPVDGDGGYYVICPAPAGLPLSEGLRPWPEAVVVERVLRPMAAVLEQLQSRATTHRAIRPNNVFHGPPDRPILLGSAWAAPPAFHQPAVFETPYAAMCHPSARGDGRIADDIYALGILLLTLVLGRVPLGGLDDTTIIHRKLELGDFAAVSAGERIPPMLTDLVRGMLAEDPEHRPAPAMLRDPANARARRVATRPPARAQRPFKIGELAVWNTRTMAFAMGSDPVETLTAIHSGTLMYWVRRVLGDSTLAVSLEEMFRQQAQDQSPDKDAANATLVMRAVAMTDVLMPLCWRGLAVFPDGLGPAFAAAEESHLDLSRKLREIVVTEAQGTWAGMREEKAQAAPLRLDARQWRAILQIKPPAGGLPRLTYTLNPLAPCASPLLEGSWIVLVDDLPAALDAIATPNPETEVLDAHIAAFIAARSERWLDQEIKALSNDGDAAFQALTALRLLGELQNRFHKAPLKRLAAWVAARSTPLVERWQNRERRAAVEERLKVLAAEGFIPPIVSLLADINGQTADAEALRAAREELARLDAALREIAEGGPGRTALAARLGQEIAAGLGIAAAAVTLVLTALG